MRSFSFALVAVTAQERRTVWPSEIMPGFTMHFCAAAGEASIEQSTAAGRVTFARVNRRVRRACATLAQIFMAR